MYCHQCGSIVSDDAVTCGACGAPQRPARQKTETQSVPMADASATLRMTPLASVPVPGSRPVAVMSPQPATAVMTPPAIPAATLSSAPRSAARKNPATAVLLGGIAALMLVAWSGYQWSLRRAVTQDAAVSAAQTVAPADNATSAGDGAASAVGQGPAVAPAPASLTSDNAPPRPEPTLAQLTAARQERDAAIAQRDSALDQVRQLRDDLAHGRSAAPTPTSAVDALRLTQLQRDRDTLHYVAGPRKLLLANKVIESHLYLLPPPSDLVSLNLGQTTEITLSGDSYGMNKIRDLQVIPSSVWEGTDYRYTITGTTVKFTILKADAFRSFAKYFVILLNN